MPQLSLLSHEFSCFKTSSVFDAIVNAPIAIVKILLFFIRAFLLTVPSYNKPESCFFLSVCHMHSRSPLFFPPFPSIFSFCFAVDLFFYQIYRTYSTHFKFFRKKFFPLKMKNPSRQKYERDFLFVKIKILQFTTTVDCSVIFQTIVNQTLIVLVSTTNMDCSN